MHSLQSYLEHHEVVENSAELAKSWGVDHQVIVGQIKSLELQNKVATTLQECITYILTKEGENLLSTGSSAPFRLWQALDSPLTVKEAQKLFGKEYGKALGSAKSMGWISVNQGQDGPTLSRKTDLDQDPILASVQRFSPSLSLCGSAEEIKKQIEELIQSLHPITLRSLKPYLSESKSKYFKVSRTSKFFEDRKTVSEVTTDMITMTTEELSKLDFKPRNLTCKGKQPEGHGGALHPLMQMRSAFRKIFLSMGFTEMPTNRYVENSFFNFDALFQPQHHPARDAHDTFFLSRPESCNQLPIDYQSKVKKIHEEGGFGSIGWRYNWSESEAKKNILRTHTTAVSARLLYKLACDGFKPCKLFSIDRVFRNESVDATHLAEFHQVEGVVAGRNLSLGHLIGLITEFFEQLGMTDLKFKPTFNPYTEPSMEIFAFHKGLDKWVEIGNSGIFRPEMLRPMGLPSDVTVCAWGLSLERPTMIMSGISRIRDLFGHKVDLSLAHSAPLPRFKKGVSVSL
ncbi:hypothetical protein P9112_013558 [Eukaryota sp. TZLM1-RC]